MPLNPVIGSSSNLALARLIALLAPLALLLGAYGSEHIGGLYPCEMCYWQRWPHMAAIVLAALAFAVPRLALPLVALAGVAILASGGIGLFHAGVEYGWWEGLTRCATTGGGSGDILADIMATPLVRCDQAQWDLMGVSLAGFNALFSIGTAVAIFLLLSRRRATA